VVYAVLFKCFASVVNSSSGDQLIGVHLHELRFVLRDTQNCTRGRHLYNQLQNENMVLIQERGEEEKLTNKTHSGETGLY
jgi:hypothetical protein